MVTSDVFGPHAARFPNSSHFRIVEYKGTRSLQSLGECEHPHRKISSYTTVVDMESTCITAGCVPLLSDPRVLAVEIVLEECNALGSLSVCMCVCFVCTLTLYKTSIFSPHHKFSEYRTDLCWWTDCILTTE